MKKILLLGLLALSAFALDIDAGEKKHPSSMMWVPPSLDIQQNAILVTGVKQNLAMDTSPLPVILKTDKYTYLGESKTNISSDRIAIRLIKKCDEKKCDEKKCEPIRGFVSENGVYGVEGIKVINQNDIAVISSALVGIMSDLMKSDDPVVKKLYTYYQSLYLDTIAGSLLVDGNKTVQIFEMK